MHINTLLPTHTPQIHIKYNECVCEGGGGHWGVVRVKGSI